MAAGYGLNGHAHAIMAAVHDLDPGSAAPLIGTSISLIGAGRNDEAAALLERAVGVVAERDRHVVTAFRGWALQRAGRRAESEHVLRALVPGTDDVDNAAAELATALLNEGGQRR